jgi:hypothetical protein
MRSLSSLYTKYSQSPAWIKDGCSFLVILAASLLVARPLFSLALLAHTDTHSTLIRMVGLVHVWQDGQIIGRWLPDINLGYGYPLLNFYAPLFSYLSAGIFFLVQNYILAVNLLLILGFILSGWVMYLFARDFWGRSGGLLSAVAYLLVPYHSCEVYRRAANAEFLTFIFVPLIAWRFYRFLADMKLSTFVWAVLSVTGLILCHNVMTILFLPVVAMYTLFLCVLDPRDIWKKMCLSAGVVVCALGLTAYFWLPAMVEKQFVTINKIYEGAWDFHHHFMTLKQFIFSPWECGSISWTNGVSFQLGMTNFLLAIAALAAVLFSWRVYRKNALHFLFWLVMGVLIAFMTLRSSTVIWEALPIAKYVQYPWRLFLPLTFIIAFLAGGVVCWCRQGHARILIAILGMGIVVGFNASYSVIDKQQTFDLKDRGEFLFHARPMDNMEYLPKWVKTIPLAPPQKRYEVVKGEALIVEQKKISGVHHELTVAAKTPALVCFHHFYFPGWRVFVDNKEIQILPDNPYGLILFVVPPGVHHVKIFFGQTSVRIAGDAISLIFLCFLTGMLFRMFFVPSRRR